MTEFAVTDHTDDLTVREPRCDGWTTERQFEFLDDLSRHGNIVRAAAMVGLSPSSAYRARARDPYGAFAHGWRAATAMAYHRLRDLALERIENGVMVPQFYKGEVCGMKPVFSDRLLLGLLNHLKPAAPVFRSDAPSATDPVEAFAATIDAFATALETGTDSVVPPPLDAASPKIPDADPDDLLDQCRVARARSRRAFAIAGLPDQFNEDIDPVLFADLGLRRHPPYPNAGWLADYPHGITPDEAARESATKLAIVGFRAAKMEASV